MASPTNTLGIRRKAKRQLLIMKKIHLNYSLSLTISFACAFVLLFAFPSYAQEELTPLQKVQSLKNPSFAKRITVYYSPGYEKRAKELQSMVEEAMGFYERKLKLRAELSLAVLTRDQWQQVRAVPYGLPNVSSPPHVAFLPATADGVVTADALSLKSNLSPATMKKLKSSGYTFDQAAVKFVDLIGLHELGHTYAVSLGLVPPRPNKWFSEFLASYFAYAYLREKRPKLATLFYVMAADLALEVPRPKYTSLEDFERLYSGVGPKNYGWYQGRFFQRVAQVYDAKGLSFITEVLNAFPAAEGESLPFEVVLQRLEKISPGFMEWSKDLR
jgi:hypothetical protein